VQSTPRLKSITGVARALIATVGTAEAVRVLIEQFGWDVTFCALSHLGEPEAGPALWQAALALETDGAP
jgi:hypothetical protein